MRLPLRLLDLNQIEELLPEVVQCAEVWHKRVGWAMRSDVVRLAMLEKYGGVWADATLVTRVSCARAASRRS